MTVVVVAAEVVVVIPTEVLQLAESACLEAVKVEHPVQ